MELKRVTVKTNERGMLLRNGDFDRFLQPGTHWLWGGLDALKVEKFSLEQTAFAQPIADRPGHPHPRQGEPAPQPLGDLSL